MAETAPVKKGFPGLRPPSASAKAMALEEGKYRSVSGRATARRQSETGHARNVANFGELAAFVETFGAIYSPANAAIALPALKSLRTSLAAVMALDIHSPHNKRSINMRTITLTLLAIIAMTITTNAQWTQQTSGTTNNLISVFFIDSNIGYVVGASGKIIKTTNGGTNWTAQTSGTSYNLLHVYFVDANIGWAVGLNGTIIKTTDGGNNWTTQESGTRLSENPIGCRYHY